MIKPAKTNKVFLSRIKYFGTVVVVVFLSMAIGSMGAFASAISQGYKAIEPIDPGALVSILAESNSITPADTKNSNGLLGVAVDGNQSTLAINNGSAYVQVATSGVAQLFVSDLNGPIKPGDQIAPSPIKGVGMKALENGKVVGVAQAAFDGKESKKTTTVTTTQGEKQEVHVGIIPVSVQVVYYTVPSRTVVPGFLQQFAETIAGKPVPVAKLALIGVILTVAMVIVALLLFSAVRGALISIGRNPLAQKNIYRGMFQVILASFTIMAVAISGSWMLLSF